MLVDLLSSADSFLCHGIFFFFFTFTFFSASERNLKNERGGALHPVEKDRKESFVRPKF